MLMHGVVGADDVVGHGVQLVDRSMSHTSYVVSIGGERRFFAKLADPVRSQGRTLAAEAAVYRLARSHPALAATMPRCWLVTDDETLIVLDAVTPPPVDASWSVTGPLADGAGVDEVLGAYGELLARIHSVRPAPFGERPWLLEALEQEWHRDPNQPPAVRELFRDVAGRPAFRRGFAEARRAWQATALIHGDLRWANLLTDAEAGGKLLLVDWELACVGDPAWDLGSAMVDVLGAAVVSSGRPPAMPGLLDLTLPLLAGYREEARMEPDGWRRLIERSLRLGGVRLVQSLGEHGHMGAESLATVYPLLLPLSAELLQRAPTAAGALAARTTA